MTSAIPDIQSSVKQFYKDDCPEDRPHGRSRSWVHCYTYFKGLRNRIARGEIVSNDQIELGALHLGFYLASWGMYRGSSKILQHSFMIHVDSVQVLLNSRYVGVWNVDPTLANQQGDAIDLIEDCRVDLTRIYSRQKPAVTPTDTLMSKILLATLACCPAYDVVFLRGLGVVGIKQNALTPLSLAELFEFYRRNRMCFESARLLLSDEGRNYPPMKLVDMYFWQVGYEAIQKDRAKRKRKRS